MPFTFPSDNSAAPKAGAVKVNADGASFHVPTVLYQADGVTAVNEANPLTVGVPPRVLVFSTTTPLAGNPANYTSPSIDGLNYKSITGRVSANTGGNLIISQSDDGETWDETSKSSYTAGAAIIYNEPIVARYVQVAFFNLGGAQSMFRLSGYLSEFDGTVRGQQMGIRSSNGYEALASYSWIQQDGISVSTNLYPIPVQAYNSLLDDSGGAAAKVDRQRNNTQGTALASGARTATTFGSDITNFNAKGVLVYLDVTSAIVGAGLQVVVQAKDPASSKYVDLQTPPTAVTGVGTKVFELYPGADGTGIAQRTSGVLPRIWRIKVIAGDANAYTYSVGYSLIL